MVIIMSDDLNDSNMKEEATEKEAVYAFRWDYYEDRSERKKTEKKMHRRDTLIYALLITGAFAALFLLLALVLLK